MQSRMKLKIFFAEIIIINNFSDIFSTLLLNVLQKTIVNIVPSIESRNIKSEFPPVNAFRDGLTQVKGLTRRECHGRIFILYFSLMHNDCCELLINND